MINTVFIRTLVPIFLVFILLILALWIIFITSFGLFIKELDRGRTTLLSEKLQSILTDLYKNQIDPEDEIIRSAIQPFLPEDSFLIILDSDKEPLFAFRNNPLNLKQTSPLNWAKNYVSRHEHEISYKDLDSVGYFFFGETGFRKNQANRRLMTAVNITISLGILVSAVLSFLFAFFFSRSLSARTVTLMKGIKKISSGSLDHHIEETGPREFTWIAESANTLAKKLKNEKELRSRWIQDITHDLRTPLSAMRAQLEGILDRVLDPGPGRLRLILAELGRIETLVNDFNQLMELESPEMIIKKDTINCNDLLDQVVHGFSVVAEKKNITINTNSEVNECTGDRNLLLRALSNLISNAVRYANTGGVISIRIYREKDRVVLSIFNTGKTIPAAEIPRVFDRLYRGEYARNSSGSGLGLSITKRIAELHGGTVNITSNENTGTTVFLIFPG